VRTVFIVLMVLLALAVVAVAMLNQEIVMVNYIFGQVELPLIAVILGSALCIDHGVFLHLPQYP